MQLKHIRLFVEGQGDRLAAPVLVKKVIKHFDLTTTIALQHEPMIVGEFGKIVNRNGPMKFRRLLQTAVRAGASGCLLLIDGDTLPRSLCHVDAARKLIELSIPAGAGSVFSMAVVIARQEFESWLISGIASVAGMTIEGGKRIKLAPKVPANPEESRGGKLWLKDAIDGGYHESRDQKPLTILIPLEAIQKAGLRSFQRLESAVQQLAKSLTENSHILSPPPK